MIRAAAGIATSRAPSAAARSSASPSGHVSVRAVVATAACHRAPVVTSDPGDLTHIADSISVKIRLYTT